MNKSKLEMEFKDEEGKKFSLTLDEPREDITTEEIRTVMDDIVARSIFNAAGGDVVLPVGARVITTTTEELAI